MIAARFAPSLVKIPVTAYPPPWRTIAAALWLASCGGQLVLVALLLFFETRLSNPLRLVRVFAEVALLPGLGAWLVFRAFAAVLEIRDGILVIDSSTRRVEVPCDSIESAVPWKLPVPSSGLWLNLRSGRRLPFALGIANPAPLLAAINGSEAASGNAVAFAQLAPAVASPLYRPIVRYALFALLPAVPLFRLHQWITYGGTFGEYYQYGLVAYLLAFAVYWAHAAVWLVLLDTVLGAVAGALMLGCAFAVPPASANLRRPVLIARDILYYGSVPAFLLRLLMLSS